MPCIATVKLEGTFQGAASHQGCLMTDTEAKVSEIRGLEVKEADPKSPPFPSLSIRKLKSTLSS